MSNIDLVTVETMPKHLRGSHRAAGNWGVYPLNGAEREVVERAVAEAMIEEDEDGYAFIVECNIIEPVIEKIFNITEAS